MNRMIIASVKVILCSLTISMSTVPALADSTPERYAELTSLSLGWSLSDSPAPFGDVLAGVDFEEINLNWDWQSAPEPSQGGNADAGASAEEMAQMAEALANPLSYLWLMFAQNDTKWYDGDLLDDLNENSKVQNTLLIQPVMPFQLTETWKVVFRPVIPINSFETIGDVDITTGTVLPQVTGVDFDRKTGLGDIVLWTAFTKQYEPPFVFGFGPTIMLPTATDDQLGTGKWSAGPMVMAMNITDKWILGGVFQHWWSFAGDDSFDIDTSLGPVTVDRPDVSLTDFQYIIRYRTSALTNFGVAPYIQYNHETDELSLPVGMGFDTLIKIGKLQVKIGAEVYYFVQQDDKFGPEWQLRVFFTPVLPSPKWSRNPLF